MSYSENKYYYMVDYSSVSTGTASATCRINLYDIEFYSNDTLYKNISIGAKCTAGGVKTLEYWVTALPSGSYLVHETLQNPYTENYYLNIKFYPGISTIQGVSGRNNYGISGGVNNVLANQTYTLDAGLDKGEIYLLSKVKASSNGSINLHIFADKELPPLNKRAVKVNNENLNTINGESVKTIINANNKINLSRYKLKGYKPYLTFSSPSSFTLKTVETPNWDGTIEYSTDTTMWSIWDGSLINSGNNKLYLRGKGNTRISGPIDLENPFIFTLYDTSYGVSCDGNIETLLDYEMVMRGEHPPMGSDCFAGLFMGTSEHINPLIKGPDLPATELSSSCYQDMFSWSAITTAPELPATTLSGNCYADMFYGCPNLTEPPALPATELEMGCYLGMFGCCFSLTSLPLLPATILPWACYQYMFTLCPNIRLSTIQTEEYNIPFRIPYSGNATETEDNSLEYMFWLTGGTFTDTPSINTTYYLAASQKYKPYITFSSPSSFTISKPDSCRRIPWDGIVEYSTDTEHWTEWDMSTISSVNNVIYLRGTNNTYITQLESEFSFVFTGEEISCTGNIETLLDYRTVMRGEHPPMYEGDEWTAGCFASLFDYCTNLVEAPDLPAMNLTRCCYVGMFSYCISLKTPPELPATTLTHGCYNWMFTGCTSLMTLPKLPATTLAPVCYFDMFFGCENIRLSTIQTDIYTIPYRIPSVGTGIGAQESLEEMFQLTGGTFTGTPTINTTYYLAPPTDSFPYLTFSSPNSFTLSTKAKDWDGIVEYYDDSDFEWKEWKDDAILRSGIGNKLYLRGKGNTHISVDEYGDGGNPFVFTGSDISCDGNIETLLDYEAVMRGEHPQMAESCFYGLFEGSYNNLNPIIKGPDLPATNLTMNCYADMYSYTALAIAPELPATTLAYACYHSMFFGCTNLTKLPELPATELSDACYAYMFEHCHGLTSLPDLPATTLPDICYWGMFSYCSNIRLSTIETEKYNIPYRIPVSGSGSEIFEDGSLGDMFDFTGGTFTGTPMINTTYYLAPSTPNYSLNIPYTEMSHISDYTLRVKLNAAPINDNDYTLVLNAQNKQQYGGDYIRPFNHVSKVYIYGIGAYDFNNAGKVLVYDPNTSDHKIPYNEAIEITLTEDSTLTLYGTTE